MLMAQVILMESGMVASKLMGRVMVHLRWRVFETWMAFGMMMASGMALKKLMGQERVPAHLLHNTANMKKK